MLKILGYDGMPNGIPMGLHRTVFCALALYHFISRHLSLYEAGLPRDETRLGSVMSCLVCGNVCVFRGSLQPVHALLPPEDKRSTVQIERKGRLWRNRTSEVSIFTHGPFRTLQEQQGYIQNFLGTQVARRSNTPQ